MPKRILILDTDTGVLGPLGEAFRQACGRGCRVDRVTRGDELLGRVASGYDLVLLDQELGDGHRDGLELVTAIRQRAGDLPVVLVAERGDVQSAEAAIRSGATDFLVRGPHLPARVSTQLGKISHIVQLMEDKRRLERQNRLLRASAEGRRELVGQSPQMQTVLAQISRVAPVPRPVLVLGERGTGKELVARAIHATSSREGAFVVVNCAAVTDTLLEAELFGHERGAYTGADKQVPGKFELAAQGTLFLDEIGHMSLPFQQKILRVVEYGTLLRVGGTSEVRVDVRIIAATNADLPAMMERGAFLRDLYDRLAFEVIRVPPLRERTGDVVLLARHFLEQFMREVPAFQGKRLGEDALALLQEYPFPGNVRELKHVIERAVYRDRTNEVTVEDIDLDLAPGAGRGPPGSFKQRIEALEHELIQGALREAHGNQAEAARNLGLAYHQFRYYLRKHGGE